MSEKRNWLIRLQCQDFGYLERTFEKQETHKSFRIFPRKKNNNTAFLPKILPNVSEYETQFCGSHFSYIPLQRNFTANGWRQP